MKKTLRTFVMVLVVLLLVPRGTLAQAPRPQDLDLVARYLDQAAVGVVRIDIARLDTDAVLNDVARALSDFFREKDPGALGSTDEPIKQAREEARKWRERFAAAGGRDLYLVLVFNPAADPPVFGVVPTDPEAKTAELIELLKELPPPLGRSARVVGGAIVTGSEALTTGLPLGEATRREELARELKRAGDAPVQLALIPADFVRRAIEENMPELPADLGGGPSTVLTKGAVSGCGSLAVAPSWSLKIILQSESEEAATALAATLKRSVANATESAEPGLAKELVAALTPRAEGDLVIVAIGAERFATLKKSLVPALLEARRAARRMISAVKVRQHLVGCMVYAQDHNNQWPKDLQALITQGILPPDGLQDPARPDAKEAYAYIRPDVEQLSKTDWSQHMVVYETFAAWPKEGVWAGYADGHVDLVNDEAAFKKLTEYAKKHAAKD